MNRASSLLSFRRLLATAALICIALLAAGCSGGGDTDGGAGNDTSNPNDGGFVSDGGAGGTIFLTMDDEVNVGQVKEFILSLRDPQGNGIPFVRIFCDSEQGLAIIEPNSGGVAFEHTSANGNMSGRFGGVEPGSYIFECRGPAGYGLIVRKTINVRGPVPAGFSGFGGAAGGTIGGGTFDDDDSFTDQSVRLTSVALSDTGADGNGTQMDITRGQCGTSNPTTEPFGDAYIAASVSNGSSQRVFIESATMTFRYIDPAGTAFPPQTVNVDSEISAGSSGTVRALLARATGGGKSLLGGSALAAGAAQVDVTIRGRSVNGSAFSVDASTTITLENYDRCD